MIIEMARQITVHALRKTNDDKFLDRYVGCYDSIVCIGEMVRNICVNLNIDPDTQEGITRNISICTIDLNNNIRMPFVYNPLWRVSRLVNPGISQIHFEIVCLDDLVE